MSRRSILLEQQRVVPTDTPGQPVPQGRCLYPVALYDNPGLYWNGTTDFRTQIFTLPAGLEIQGVREGEFFQITDLSSTRGKLEDLGIDYQRYTEKFPYAARFSLVDAAAAAAGGIVKHTPDYLNFTNPGIYQQPPDININLNVVGGSTTNTRTTSERTPTSRTTTSWVTYGEEWTPQGGSKQYLRTDLYHNVGTNLADQVPGTLTYPNVVRVLGATSAESVDSPGTAGVPVAVQNSLSAGFRGNYPTATQYFSSADMVSNASNPTVFAAFSGITRYFIIGGTEVYAARIFQWSRAGYGPGLTGRVGIYVVAQVKKVTTTTTFTVIPGTTTTTTRVYARLNQLDKDGNTLRSEQKRLRAQPELDRQSYQIFSTTAPQRITIGINPYQRLLQSYDTPLPRGFTNRAETCYLIGRLPSDIEPLSLSVRGQEIQIPSNATVNADDGHLEFEGSWDGQTFISARARCPAWMVYWVLTNPEFKVNYGPSDFDLDSFYQASIHNNEMIGEEMRWPYDGLLSGSVQAMVADLLSSMRGVLYRDEGGRWVLTQERPESRTRWIISDASTVEGRLTYQLATAKPAVQATYFSNLTATEETTRRVDLGDTQQAYPGQSAAAAQRWANYRTFETQHLGDTLEFTVPFMLKNNQGTTIDFFRMRLFDLLECYDTAVMGIRLSGLVTEAAAGWLQVDRLPMELFPGGGLIGGLDARSGWMSVPVASDRGLRLTVQQRAGGTLSSLITRVDYNPCDRRQNRVHFTGHMEVPNGGDAWAIKVAGVQPRTFRIISLIKADDGLSTRVICRPYIGGFHEHIETGAELTIPNHIWNPPCGTNVSDFQGYVADVHKNYPAQWDEFNGPIDSWNGPVDSWNGFVDNLNTSCR